MVINLKSLILNAFFFFTLFVFGGKSALFPCNKKSVYVCVCVYIYIYIYIYIYNSTFGVPDGSVGRILD